MTFTPFEKELKDLDENQLKRLIDNSISESWYIEYKREFPKANGKIDPQKLTKIISAFANTKGGWLFYGITTNNNNTPLELTGININEYSNITDQVKFL